jgi:hypothetical protein
MSIKREDLDAGRVDFADVGIGKRLPLKGRSRKSSGSGASKSSAI